MRRDFCAFILTHGRAGNVITVETLKRHGYTGKVFIVIDDEDEAGDDYRREFGDAVLVFSKDEAARYTDPCDNFPDRQTPLWARNACWGLAEREGYTYFIQLDDDYRQFHYRRMGRGHRLSDTQNEEYHGWTMRRLDAIFTSLVRVIQTTPVKTIAFSQGGDHIGGEPAKIRFRRKAMNSFVCSTAKPFLFRGRLNDDVNTYVSLGSVGDLFFTDMDIQLEQLPTQANAGGITDAYLDAGTYVKSFYTVMLAPSCVRITTIGRTDRRPHHKINWRRAVPRIVPPEFRRAD